MTSWPSILLSGFAGSAVAAPAASVESLRAGASSGFHFTLGSPDFGDFEALSAFNTSAAKSYGEISEGQNVDKFDIWLKEHVKVASRQNVSVAATAVARREVASVGLRALKNRHTSSKSLSSILGGKKVVISAGFDR